MGAERGAKHPKLHFLTVGRAAASAGSKQAQAAKPQLCNYPGVGGEGRVGSKPPTNGWEKEKSIKAHRMLRTSLCCGFWRLVSIPGKHSRWALLRAPSLLTACRDLGLAELELSQHDSADALVGARGNNAVAGVAAGVMPAQPDCYLMPYPPWGCGGGGGTLLPPKSRTKVPLPPPLPQPHRGAWSSEPDLGSPSAPGPLQPWDPSCPCLLRAGTMVPVQRSCCGGHGSGRRCGATLWEAAGIWVSGT